MIEIEGLRFRYPGAEADAIRDLSLQVDAGRLFGLLGPNGSGKTTLISLLTGLLRPAAGGIRINNQPLPAATRRVQQNCALAPQEYAFYPRLTVFENLRFFAGVLALRGDELDGRVDEAIAATALQSFESKRAERLSGGLKRRLNLAIALLNRPSLLFLDEPTVGIDPQSRHFILEAIRRINAAGTTVVYTSHYMEEVEALCNDIAVLDDGQLLAHGTLAELLGNTGPRQATFMLDTEPDPALQKTLDRIGNLEIGGREVRVAPCDSDRFKTLVARLGDSGVDINRVKYGHGNLEELFLHLTGRGLRD